MTSAVEQYVAQHQQRFLEELSELLRIPSISTTPDHRADVERCAAYIAEQLRRIGCTRAEVMPTAGLPVVYGELPAAPGAPTVLIYGHYDVQPVDPLDLWETPPFEPSVRNGELYARGAADDKGQIFMHWKAVETYTATVGRLPLNLKFLLEGEEEIGSPSLDDFISSHRDLLAADVALISDTSMFARGVPSLTYGLRGLAYMQVDVYGARGDLHSGSYGGSIQNPIEALCRIVAALKDPDGRIAVPGFYDSVRPLSPEERAEFARLPFDEAAELRELGVPAPHGEPGYTTLERRWARPTLELNGIWGGFQGEGSKTVLPAEAHAKISCRLVPDQDPHAIADLVMKRVHEVAPPGVRVEARLLNWGRPAITPIDHPATRAAARALERGFGKRPVLIRSGGTIPVVATLNSVLGLPTVLLGIALPDDHAHAPNERLDLETFFAGIRTTTYLWDELARALSGRARSSGA